MIRQKKSGSGDRVQTSRSGSASSSGLRNSESPQTRRRSEESPSRYQPLDLSESEEDRTRAQRTSRQNSEALQRQICPSLPSASSDEDIDPELREGIHNIMKLRDEYDKLEGALRKLGVDPENVNQNVNVGHNNVAIADDFEDEENLFDDDDYSDFDDDVHEVNRRPINPVPPPLILSSDNFSDADFSAISADPFGNLDHPSTNNSGNPAFTSDESLQPRTARLRHLEILEEVDESLLSSDAGEDPPLPPPPPPSYPWIQMALPGGGIVSVPLHTDTTSESGAAASGSHRGEHSGHHSKALAAHSSTSGLPPPPPSVTGADLLTVPAGEPVTHFNLDQLLEIVQSFQLDTTMAGHEQSGHNMDLGSLMQQAPEGTLTQGSKDSDRRDLTGCDVKHCDTNRSSSRDVDDDDRGVGGGGVGGEEGGGSSGLVVREIHSCPSSPTETECSSGFSTLRRRSVTLTEKIRTSRDGSKTQVVRQYGCNTTSAGEPNSTMTYQQKSFVYINGAKVATHMEDGREVLDDDVDEMGCSMMGGGSTSQSFPSLIPITSASQVSSNHPSTSSTSYHHGHHHGSSSRSHGATTLPRSGADSSSIRGATQANNAANNSSQTRGQHFVRLNSIEPNTVMFSTKDYPILTDVSVPEIIDELEKQFSDKLCDLQGVRLVANNVYICLSRRESLQHLSTYGFYVRGVPVKLVDITHDSVVLCLSGVPHYITDATVTMLVGTFGIAIGEVERRFYKGVDTGERYVRLKPRSHTQVPDQITVGGCKIFISVLSNEEVCQPYILHSATADPPQPYLPTGESYNSQTTAHFANSSIMPSSSSDRGSGVPGNFRAKPGHCNGTVNSPGEAPNSSMLMMMPLPPAMTSFASMSNRCDDSSSLPASPKIGKSFRSRISIALRSPPSMSCNQGQPEGGIDEVDRTYIPGEDLNFPSLSPPPYKTPSSAGSSSTSNGARHDGGRHVSATTLLGGSGNNNKHGNGGVNIEEKKSSMSMGTRKYGRQSNKTDSSTSLASQTGNNGKPEPSNSLGFGKRTSVVFEEPRAPTITTVTSHSSTSTAPPNQSGNLSRAAMATSKTVNGILRKGSVPGDDIVPSTAPQPTTQLNLKLSPPGVTPPGGPIKISSNKNNNDRESSIETQQQQQQQQHHHSRKTRKSKEKHSSNKSGKSRSSKLDSLPESGLEDGDSTLPRSSRSRSSSSKSSSKADKSAKDLALTRDLPWCGCWGNGCL